MSAPLSRFGKLSLDDMSPSTRSQSRAASVADSGHHYTDESSSDLESDSDYSDVGDETPAVVRSPTKLIYSLDQLSNKTKTAVQDVFNEPPKIALQRCRLIDNTYAFQMTELVTRSIRIRALDDGTSNLSCSCGEEAVPCEHLVWLLDQLLKQTLYDHDHDKPLTMTAEGYAVEMGDPFKNIAKYHLDVLADGLHCQLVDPEITSEEDLASHRVQESRELLSSVYSTPPEDFRSDIFERPATGKKTLKRNDLDCTIFRMLLENHHFFQYFLSVSRPSDPINDPFRKLLQRVDRVLRSFDAFNETTGFLSPDTDAAVKPSAETPRDVPWAAKHLLGSVKLIRSAIYTRDRPLQAHEATSAARTLVHILEAVVSRNRDTRQGASRIERNLYLRLVGDRDGSFVIAELTLIPEAASQFLHSLEAIQEQLGGHGAPATYVEKFRKLLSRLRTSTTGSGLKRQVQGQESYRGSKRMK